jgi:glycosyltransferase involved in cell wall biosynthesis
LVAKLRKLHNLVGQFQGGVAAFLWLNPSMGITTSHFHVQCADSFAPVHHFVAISTEVQARIKRFYGRESVVIPPPVETTRFQPAAAQDDYFLILSRLVPYKRIDLAVAAFNELGLPLVSPAMAVTGPVTSVTRSTASPLK